MNKSQCLFCRSEQIVWEFDAPSFALGPVNSKGESGEPLVMESPFPVCQRCCDLIMIDTDESRQQLGQILFTAFVKTNPEMIRSMASNPDHRKFMTSTVAGVVTGFFAVKEIAEAKEKKRKQKSC